jgi:hypothetical protein
MEKEKKVKDVDFADSAVPSSARKNVVTMFMIMLGFTFFSASSSLTASISGAFWDH